MVDIHREGRSQRSAPQKRHKAHRTGRARKLRLGLGRREVALHLKRVRSSSSWLPELLEPGRHKMQPQLSLRLCGVPENLKLQLRRGKCTQLQPAPCRATWSLSSVDGESTHREQGQTQCGRNTASIPHTRQWHLSAVPLPPHSTTEQANLSKRPPPPTCVRAEIRHCRDLQTEAK